MIQVAKPDFRTRPRGANPKEVFPNLGYDNSVNGTKIWLIRDIYRLGYSIRYYTESIAMNVVAFVKDSGTPLRQEPILIDDGGTITLRNYDDEGIGDEYKPVLKIALRGNAPDDLRQLVKDSLNRTVKWGNTTHDPPRPLQEGTVLYAVDRWGGQRPSDGKVAYLDKMVDKMELLRELGVRTS